MLDTQNALQAVRDGDTDLHVLLQGLALIIFSEIGDKTFLLAALLAARHPRRAVFLGAFASLIAMSVLSASLGHALARAPRAPTKLAAALLFCFFGAKLVREGVRMGEEEGRERLAREMREAQEEIEMDDAMGDADALGQGQGQGLRHDGDEDDNNTLNVVGGGGDGDGGCATHEFEQTRRGRALRVPLEAIERGEGVNSTDEGSSSWYSRRARGGRRTKRGCLERAGEGLRNLGNLLLGPVFMQAFALTFIGEWGDRSQIATIALGASYNLYLVAIGTIVGHGLCTALAVMGGRYISTKISVKHITLGGGTIFILFAFIYLYEAYTILNVPDVQFLGSV